MERQEIERKEGAPEIIIAPFIMLYNPALNFVGSAGDIILACVTTTIGIILFAVVLEGYLLRALSWPERIIFCIAGIGIVMPLWAAGLTGLAILIVTMSVFLVSMAKRKKRTGPRISEDPTLEYE